jgi:hypothetical protein
MATTRRPIAGLALLALCALLAACSKPLTKDEQRARQIERAFVGAFVGTLELPDAGGAVVSVAARMRGTRRSEGGVLLEIEHDEGGGKVRRGSTVLQVDGLSRTLVYSPADGKPPERYRIEGFAAFTGLGELIVSGSAEEAGAPLDVRILYSVAPDRITWTKDARPPGGAFKLRHRYTMRRAR